MSDEQSDPITALVPVAETMADDTAGVPVFDWRGIQRFAWGFGDWLQENIKPLIDGILLAWQQSGLADLGAALVEQERLKQRQRVTAAKQRARIVTRAKGSSRP